MRGANDPPRAVSLRSSTQKQEPRGAPRHDPRGSVKVRSERALVVFRTWIAPSASTIPAIAHRDMLWR